MSQHPLDFPVTGSLAVLLREWVQLMPRDEGHALVQVYAWIHSAMEQARSAPSTLDRRAIALTITKLEEAEHWVLECMRVAVDREVEAKKRGVDSP